MKKNNAFSVLNFWYYSNCDGDWEHEFGVKIETLDNPGWSLKIDLVNTSLEGFKFNKSVKNDINNWYEITVKEDIFYGYGSNIEEIINIFYTEFLKPSLSISNYTYTVYAILPNILPKVWTPIEAKMIDIDTFEVVRVFEVDWKNLKIKKVEDFDKLVNIKLPSTLKYQQGDILSCKLEKMYDYPCLVIQDHLG